METEKTIIPFYLEYIGCHKVFYLAGEWKHKSGVAFRKSDGNYIFVRIVDDNTLCIWEFNDTKDFMYTNDIEDYKSIRNLMVRVGLDNINLKSSFRSVRRSEDILGKDKDTYLMSMYSSLLSYSFFEETLLGDRVSICRRQLYNIDSVRTGRLFGDCSIDVDKEGMRYLEATYNLLDATRKASDYFDFDKISIADDGSEIKSVVLKSEGSNELVDLISISGKGHNLTIKKDVKVGTYKSYKNRLLSMYILCVAMAGESNLSRVVVEKSDGEKWYKYETNDIVPKLREIKRRLRDEFRKDDPFDK